MPAERTMPSPKVAQVEARAIIPQEKSRPLTSETHRSDVREAWRRGHGFSDTPRVPSDGCERAEYAWSLYRDALADVSGEQIKAKEGK